MKTRQNVLADWHRNHGYATRELLTGNDGIKSECDDSKGIKEGDNNNAMEEEAM